MSRERILLLIDRLPRCTSLAGLLGLIGFAGVLDPGLFRFSALSFLSYLSFVRFFRRFVDADYGPHRESAPMILIAVGVAVMFPFLISISPILGFLGFAGTLCLYDPPRSAGHLTAA